MRKKDYEEQIAHLEQESGELQRRVSELYEQVEGYRRNEAAIAGALTEAQYTAKRIAEDAAHRRDELLRAAEDERQHCIKEADEIVESAKTEARRIVAQANADKAASERRMLELENDYEARKEWLMGRLRRTAESASGALSELNSFICDLPATTDDMPFIPAITKQKPAFVMPSAPLIDDSPLTEASEVPFAGEVPSEDEIPSAEGVPSEEKSTAAEAVEPAELPADYDSPATLMQTIYRIEGRELPEDDAEDKPNNAVMPAKSDEMTPVGVDRGTVGGYDESARNKEADKAFDDAFLELLNRDESPASPVDAKVVTVDDILTGSGEKVTGDSILDDELNALIDDVLSGK